MNRKAQSYVEKRGGGIASRSLELGRSTSRAPRPGSRHTRDRVEILRLRRELTEARRLLRQAGSELGARNQELILSDLSVNHAAVATFWVGSDGRIRRVNRATCNMLGYSPEELLGMHKFELRAGVSLEDWASHWDALRFSKHVFFESIFRHKNGREFPAEVQSNFVEVEGVEYVFFFVRDITDRKEAENGLHRLNSELEERVRERTSELECANQQLRESGEMFRILVESAPQSIVMADASGRISLINTQTERLFGYSRNELVGRSIDTILPNRFRVGSMDWDREKEPTRPLPSRTGLEGKELLGRRKDGTEVPVELGLKPLRIKGASFVLCTIADIAGRKEVEGALRASEARFRALAETLPQLVWTCDPDGRCDYLGPQWVHYTGIPEAEQLGYGWVEQVHPEDRQMAQETWGRASSNGTPLDVEFRVRRYDGAYRWFKTRAMPLRDETGRLVKWFGTNTDVDDIRRAEVEATASLREKETLLKEIHHRVKNNMQLVSSLLQLQSNYIRNPEALTVFREGQNRVRSMALIHEKLYRAPSLAQIDFSEYLRSLVGILMPTYSVPGDSVHVDIQAETVELGIDAAIPLALILNELISNSLKHAFPSGRRGVIRVELKSCESGEVELGVSDNGVGFPSGMDWRSSTSLGLHLVRILTGQLEGEMQVRTEGGFDFRMKFREARKPRAV